MNGIQITHLRAFLEVARRGSFTKAARELGYSEPAVHLQVTALRRMLGEPLFERHRGQMQLTRFGRRLQPLAEQAIEAIDDLLEEAVRFRVEEAHSIAIAVGRSSGSYVMPAVAGLFRQAYPAANITVRTSPGRQIIDDLIEGTIDVGFAGGLGKLVRQRGPGTHLVVVPWSRYRWVLAAAPGYLQRAVSRDEPVPVYIPAWAETLPTSLAAGFARQNVSPLFQMVESSEAAKTAAQAQVGIACVPVYTARLELAAGELRRCLEGVAFPPTSIDAIHRRPAENPMVATFVSFLRMLRSHPAMRQILLSAGDARIQAARAEIPSPVLTRRQHTRVG